MNNNNIRQDGGNNELNIINLFINKCKKSNIPYKRKKKNIDIDLKKHELYIKNKIYTHTNSDVCSKRNCDKPYNSLLLKSNNTPVPNFEEFEPIKTKKYIDNIINKCKIKYPLVVKPIDSSLGNKVFINIKDKEELKNILVKHFLNKYIKNSKTQKIMCEEYLEGYNYRILCYKNEILDIKKKIPLQIKTDTDIKLNNLLEKFNETDKKHIDYNYIKKHYKLTDTIKKNTIIILNPLSNHHQGSKLQNIKINNIHIDNINLFKKINNILNYNLCGIDFIIDDIYKSYKIQKAGINEVNKSPDISLHKDKIDFIINKLLK
tara:strand:- start:312 stop:1268 length:957 start_codon:yes stop_codon:yes gene_type:complete